MPQSVIMQTRDTAVDLARLASTGVMGVQGLERLCVSIVLSLVKKWRGQAPLDLQPDESLRDGAIGLDSLELLEAVADLNRRFLLHETGIEDHLLVSPSIDEWARLLSRHLELMGEDARLVFSSSGSEGEPEHVEHKLPALLSEVQSVAGELFSGEPGEGPSGGRDHPHGNPDPQMIGLAPNARTGELAPADAVRPPFRESADEGQPRVVSLVPPQHIFGFLFTVLLPSMMDWEVVDLSRSAPGRIHRTLRPGDVIVATPHQLELAFDAAPTVNLPDRVRAILSGAKVPSQLWKRAAGVGLPLTEVYGSTQSAGVGWRTSDCDPFLLMSDIECAQNSKPQSITGDPLQLTRLGTALPLQDVLTWSGPRRFQLGPRLDRNVQVGGVNVSPSAVARVLEAVPEVAAAAVRLDTATERLKAYVVPAAPGVALDVLETRLRRRASAKLRSPERPQTYSFGPSLPTTPSGKPSDW